MNRFKILSCAAMLGLGFAAPGAQAQGWNPQDDARHGRTENLDRGWHGDRRDWEPSRAYALKERGAPPSRRDTVFRGVTAEPTAAAATARRDWSWAPWAARSLRSWPAAGRLNR